jgi:hypothetical protein
MVPQTPRSPETPSYEELLERMARLERLLLEKDRRIAELERLLEQSRRGGKRQAAPFSRGSAKDSPKPPGREPGTQYGRAFVVRDLRDARVLSPRRLRQERVALESDVGRLLVGRYRDPQNRRLVKHLEALQPDPFRFLKQPGLEGTNWSAETELRYAVINRKTCGGGNRTSRGARTPSVLTTIAHGTQAPSRRRPDSRGPAPHSPRGRSTRFAHHLGLINTRSPGKQIRTIKRTSDGSQKHVSGKGEQS